MIMELGMEHYEFKLYTAYINDDPELILTYRNSHKISDSDKLIRVGDV